MEEVIESARELSEKVWNLGFMDPVNMVYNPLEYAWSAHEDYLRKYGANKKQVIFLGMNPGPWGMVQTGVPFGEVSFVRDWMGITGKIERPGKEHVKRPIEGFDCKKSEVSGRRLWGLFRERYGTASTFFKDHFVANYCPLVFMTESGANITPDKLPIEETELLFEACDKHLRDIVRLMEPKYLVGVGGFAEKRIRAANIQSDATILRIIHPSPASPLANRNWSGLVNDYLIKNKVWE